MNISITPSAILFGEIAFSAFARQIEKMYQISSSHPVDFVLTQQPDHISLVATYAGNRVIRKQYKVIGDKLHITFIGTTDYFSLADWNLQRELSEQIEKLLTLGMTAFTVTF